MSKPKLLVVSPPDHYLLRNLDAIRNEAEIHIGNSMSDFQPFTANADIILYSGVASGMHTVGELWAKTPKVRWIHSLSAGVEKVLSPELTESDVPVTNARGVFKRPLAEFALLGMLYFYKRVPLMRANQKARQWVPFSVDWLHGKIMGVVGYGEIGRECATLAKAAGVTIYATRRNHHKSENDPILDRAFPLGELNTMLEQVDVLVTAAALTPETRHMISSAQFAVMKPSTIVINVGRGPLIDEAALVQALQSKKIGGAALDVFEVEPLPEDSPLWDMENVLVSPHCTDRTSDPDWLDLSMELFVENFRLFVDGKELKNIVDKRAGY